MVRNVQKYILVLSICVTYTMELIEYYLTTIE